MKICLKSVLLVLFVFTITNCENLQKKIFYYTNLDFDARLSPGTRIYYGDCYVGRVTEILIRIEEKEKIVKFFLFIEYQTIAREGSKIIFKIENDNIVNRIEISPDIDFINSDILPEGHAWESTHR
jgi:hypothetical protein